MNASSLFSRRISGLLLVSLAATLLACGEESSSDESADYRPPVESPSANTPAPAPEQTPAPTTPTPVPATSGKDPGSSCNTASECAAFRCACANGTTPDASWCSNLVCQDEAATCARSCESAGGVAGAPTEPTPPPAVASLWGCRFIAHHSASVGTVRFYGTARTEAFARSVVVAQCRKAKLGGTCDEGATECVLEPVSRFLCDWRANAAVGGAGYPAYGTTEIEGAERVMDLCLASGRTYPSDCAAGVVTCTETRN